MAFHKGNSLTRETPLYSIGCALLKLDGCLERLEDFTDRSADLGANAIAWNERNLLYLCVSRRWHVAYFRPDLCNTQREENIRGAEQLVPARRLSVGSPLCGGARNKHGWRQTYSQYSLAVSPTCWTWDVKAGAARCERPRPKSAAPARRSILAALH